MDKVKLTREQAEAIKNLSTTWDENYFLEAHAERIKRRGYLSTNLMCLNDLSLSDLAKVLFSTDGYEIEQPKFQPGAEVIDMTSKNCPVITVTNHDEKHLFGYWGDDVRTCLQKKNARLATPEEIYWKKTLGRERVGDFRIGDIVLNKLLHPYVVRKETDGATRVSRDKAYEMYKDEKLFSIYPASSEKEISKESKS